jgi:hypothetical protein
MFFADSRNSLIAQPVLWIDMFCIDQHASQRSTEHLVRSHVQPAMLSCARVIFVPGAWKRSLALRRTWCIHELAGAHAKNLPVFMALVPAQRVGFLRFLEELGTHKEFSDAIGRIQLQQSSCTRNDDSSWLLQDLNRSLGETGVELSVISALRGWLLRQLRQQLASSQAASNEGAAVAKWMTLIAELLADTGEREEAVSMYRSALALIVSSCGPQHARAISCSWELAKLLVKLEKYNESVPLLTLCYETKKNLLGSTNESVLTLQHTLASVLSSLREFAQAEILFVLSLTSSRQMYGENHVRTATAAAALADLYSKMGRMAQASKFYRRVAWPTQCGSALRLSVAGSLPVLLRHRWGRRMLKH